MSECDVLVCCADTALVTGLRDVLASQEIGVEQHRDLRTLPTQAAERMPRVVVVGPEVLAARHALPVEPIKELCGTSTQVVGLLGQRSLDAAAEALALGLDDIALPPHEPPALAARVLTCLARSRQADHADRLALDAGRLLELAQTLSSGLPASAILHATTRLAAQALGMERCSIVVFNVERRTGIVAVTSEDPDLHDLRVDLGRYPEILHLAETGAPVVVLDAAVDPMLEEARAQAPDVLRGTIILFPILVEEKVVGAFFLRSRLGRRPPTDRELRFGSTVALSTGVALRGTRLFEGARATLPSAARRAVAQGERPLGGLQRYVDFFEDAADGILILDTSGSVVHANREGAALFEMAPQEFLGRDLAAFLAPESGPLLRGVLLDVAQGRPRKNFDVYGVREGSYDRCLSCSAGSVGEQGGDRLCMVSLRDVSSLREMQNELRATKEFLENLIDSSVDAIIAADMRGSVILFNKGAEKLCGFRAEEVIGKMRISQVYPPGQARDTMIQLRSEAFGGKGRLEAIRKTIRTKAGEEIPVSLTASIIYEGAEEVATVGIFSDLRERLRMQDTLTQTQERLLQTEKAAVAAQLAGAAAHELNQPLTSVLGYADMLRAKVPAESPLRRPVDIIVREGERMADIIKKISRITKYETKSYGGNTLIMDLEKSTSAPPPASASKPAEEGGTTAPRMPAVPPRGEGGRGGHGQGSGPAGG
jgi:PAS domain S-box-containing protein